MKKSYDAWIRFYMEFADKLRNVDRKDLITRIKKVYAEIGMRLPTLERGGDVIDIDPFTVFGLFNKGITNANRVSIITGFAKEFDVKADIPLYFDGIPVLNNQSATFYYFVGDRGEHDIDNLWNFFYAALDYADDNTENNKQRFISMALDWLISMSWSKTTNITRRRLARGGFDISDFVSSLSNSYPLCTLTYSRNRAYMVMRQEPADIA